MKRLVVVSVVAAFVFGSTGAGTEGVRAAEPAPATAPQQGGWVCDAYDQSAKRGRTPQPDDAGHTFPIVTVHGITGSDGDFDGIIDQSYSGSNPQPPRSLFDALAGVAGQDVPPGLPHAHVYSFSYTPDSLRWVTHPNVGGRLAATIDCLYERHGVPVSVVAHSMGGLVTRHVATTVDATGVPRSSKLGQVVTLGTPYLGSDLAAVAGGASDIAASPALTMINYLCGELGTATGSDSCAGIPFVASLNSEAGRALRAGSSELAALQRWPEVNAVAIAGNTTFRATLFGATLTAYDVGDIVVGTASATADAARHHLVSCAYNFHEVGGPLDELRKLWERGPSPQERKALLLNFFVSRPCYHSSLMRNVDVTNEVLGTLDDWLTTNATTRIEPPPPPPDSQPVENEPDAVINAWIDAVMSGRTGDAVALEVPGRDPSVAAWAGATHGPEYRAWGPTFGCNGSDTWQRCSWLRADPAESMVVQRMVDGRWRVSHPLIFGGPDGPYTIGTACVIDTTPLNVRGGPGVDWPAFDQIPVGECGVPISGEVINARSNDRPWRMVNWRGNDGWVSDLMLRIECIDETAAVALAPPEWPMIVGAESIGCFGTVAVATLLFADGDAATAAYVNEGDGWRFLAASLGLRSVCEAIWNREPNFDIGCGTA